MMTKLLLMLFSVHVWAAEVRWDPNILDTPLSNAGFSRRNVVDINRNIKQSQANGDELGRLTVRDLVKRPKSDFPFYMLRNELQARLAEVGLTLEMSEEDIALFVKQPDHILFQPISVLDNEIQAPTLSRLRGSHRSRSPRCLLVLDLVKAQRKLIPSSLPRVSVVEQVQVAQALDKRLGTNTALDLNRYIAAPELHQRMAKAGIHTIYDLLNLSEEELLEKGVFTKFEEIESVAELRRKTRPLIAPDCGDHLSRYDNDDD